MITLSQPSTCKIRDDFLIFFGLQDQACSPSSSSYETQETRIKKWALFHDFVVWHLHGILTHFAHYFKKWFDHQHICNQYTEHVVTTTNATCFPGSLPSPPPPPPPPGGRWGGKRNDVAREPENDVATYNHLNPSLLLVCQEKEFLKQCTFEATDIKRVAYTRVVHFQM